MYIIQLHVTLFGICTVSLLSICTVSLFGICTISLFGISTVVRPRRIVSNIQNIRKILNCPQTHVQ